MDALFRLLTGTAISVGGLYLFSRLGAHSPIVRSRPFVLVVVLPLVLIFLWAMKKAAGDRDKE